MIAWRLAWTWGTASGVDEVAVEWSEAADVDAGEPATRSATMVLHPTGLDPVAWALSVEGRTLGSGRLFRLWVEGGEVVSVVEVLRGVWRNVSVREGQIRLTIGDQLREDDSVLWPGPASVSRYTTERGGAEIFFADRDPGVTIAASSATVIDAKRRWPYTVFSVVWAKRKEVWGPIVIGAPGTTTQRGAPAYLISEDLIAGYWHVLVARHRCVATQVRLWARAWERPGELVLDGHGLDGAGLYDILYAEDDAGLYAYVRIPDIDRSGAVWTGAYPSSDDDMYTSWTEGEALPGGAGQVLAMLAEVSQVRCDLPAWLAAADLLDRYTLAGYVDRQVQPMQLIRQIIAVLPAVVGHSLDGAIPIVHPYADAGADGEPLVVIGRISDLGMPDRVITAVEVGYSYPAGSSEPGARVTRTPATSPYLLAAQSYGAARQESVVLTCPWVWDASTAALIADTYIRTRQPGIDVAYDVDPSLYGPGAARELRPGQVVRLTDPSCGIADRLAHVRGIEVSASSMRVDLVLRVDLLGAA